MKTATFVASARRRARLPATKSAAIHALLVCLLVMVTPTHMVCGQNVTRIGFGSCHRSLKATRPPIWDVIDKTHHPLDAWLWLGDIMYPPKKKKVFDSDPEDVTVIAQGLKEMHTNATIGYRPFLDRNSQMMVAGVWDDHDYGGNDMGAEMPDKIERRDAFWDFLDYGTAGTKRHQPERWKHNGMYHSVHLADGKVRVLVLDTRWFREKHCLPSVAHLFPFGNAIACGTRWLTSGLMLHKWAWLWGRGGCENNSVLGEEQWKWLESELLSNNDGIKSELFVVLSSVQVWSTNPAMEGWGQFPGEQRRLWNLLKRHYYGTGHENDDGRGPAPVIFLSGDVHHGEIIGQQGYLEVTSSGMTHHCGQPKLYGRLCKPILETFHAHRRDISDYYIGFNYGTLDIDWEERVAKIAVRNMKGEAVLQVHHALDGIPRSLPDFDDLPHTMDGHLIAYAVRFLWTVAVAVLVACRWLL
jgi:alkaline phosphatase D